MHNATRLEMSVQDQAVHTTTATATTAAAAACYFQRQLSRVEAAHRCSNSHAASSQPVEGTLPNPHCTGYEGEMEMMNSSWERLDLQQPVEIGTRMRSEIREEEEQLEAIPAWARNPPTSIRCLLSGAVNIRV